MACGALRLAVESDGSQHSERARAADPIRDA
ncbi:MAG: hypothetical protein ACRD1T_04180 [Acidimicrobiia bacterium]